MPKFQISLALFARSAVVVAGLATPVGVAHAASADYSKYPSILTDAHKGATITFWGWDPLEFNKPINDYVQAKAGITVQDRQIPFANLQSQLGLATQAGSLPDVFKSNTSDIPSLVQIGAVRDITDLVAPYKDYLPAIGWQQVTYQGKIWAIPANSPAGGMFYRKDVLDKYGIDPKSLDTWDRFIDAAKKIDQASGGKVSLFGYQQTISLGLQIALINLNHAQLLNGDLSVAVSKQAPEWQRTMAVIRKLLAPGVGKEIPEWTPQWYQAMKDGSLASIPAGTWFVETIKQQAPDTKGDWDFEPFPAVDGVGDRYVNFGSAAIFVSAKSTQPEAAFELAKAWSIDPEGSIGIGLEQLGVSVVGSKALDSQYVNQPNEYFANNQAYWKDATEAYDKITFSPAPTVANGQALQIFGTDLADFIGGESADDFLDKLAGDLRSQIKGAK